MLITNKEKEEFLQSVKAQIERNLKDPKKLILWVDFSVPKWKRDVIKEKLSKEYVVKESPCFGCGGFDIFIERKI